MDYQQTGLEIAIIGMAGRFAGSQTIEDFWENLKAGAELISIFPNLEKPDSGAEANGTTQGVKAGSILNDVECFDASFFGFTPREAEAMDPQHRLFLECAWEALENAGYDSAAEKRPIGLYAGVGMGTYLWHNLIPNPELIASRGFLQTLVGVDKDYLSTRASYKLNLTGPSVSLGTACSSSLVATHLACQSLLSGECDMALAAGVAVKVPQNELTLSPDEIVSPDGHCRAFDARANGTIGGNGIGAVVLKRLEDAIADRDYIYATIKGSAMNNDGALKVGYTAPSKAGIANVVRAAQVISEVEPDTVTYLEAHGTGTSLGDPIEMAATTQAFRCGTAKKGYCAVGSVKTNIGHLDAAAGISGLIKTTLAIHHKLLPPSLNFETPNPQIDFENSPFYVNTRLKEWQRNGTPRRAGVSAFGFGGTNVHIVLEEAPERETSSRPSRSQQLLLLSAKTNSALEKATANLAMHLEQHPEFDLADVAYTLQVGRKDFRYRRAIAIANRQEAIEVLKKALPSQPGERQRSLQGSSQKVLTSFTETSERSVVFLFPGQGTQYVNMSQGLYQNEATFREACDRACELLEPHLGMDLRQVLYPTIEERTQAAEQLRQTAITQPALFVVEYALAQLWMSWGIQPIAMMGHSIGEYVAACLSGVFSLEDALMLVAARGQLMQQLPAGSMLAVPLPAAEIQPLLGSALSLAAINGHSTCVVSGPTEAIDALQLMIDAKLAASDLSCRRLHTSHAFHSPMMEPILAPFKARVAQVKLREPKIPYISDVTGTWMTAQDATDPDYWALHLRQTVNLDAGLQTLFKDPSHLLLEVGPGRTLTTLVKRNVAKHAEQIAIASLRHPKDKQADLTVLLNALGQLWLNGASIDWASFYVREQRQRLPLPTYPFERQRYWIEPPTQAENGRTAPGLSGKQSDVTHWFYLPFWKPSLQPIFPQSKDLKSKLSCYLVFIDEYGLGVQLVKQLRKQGRDAIAVKIGTKFSQLSEEVYALNPEESEGYEALLKTLVDRHKQPDAIVHLWSVAPVQQIDTGRTSIEDAQVTGIYSLLFLAQALGKQMPDENCELVVISNNVQSVLGDEAISPERATLLGAVKVIPQEYFNLQCRSVDAILPSQGSWQEKTLLDQLSAEIAAPNTDRIVAYRGRNRWLQAFESVKLGSSPEQTPRIKPGGVYLITGGLGNIGLVLAHHLATEVQAKLVLLGRSDFPAKEEWECWLRDWPEEAISEKIRKIQALEAAGAEVLILQADVSNVDQMSAAIAQTRSQFGQLNGAIHAAGVLGETFSKPIVQSNKEICERQFQAKVYGTVVLEKVLQGIELDFCILLSSLSSVLGGIGYAAYAAANLFMDAFVFRHNRNYGASWTSINWDGWKFEQDRSGQAVLGSSLNEFLIEPEEGAAVFQRILSCKDLNQIVVSTGGLQARLRQWIDLQTLQEKSTAMKSPSYPRPALQSDYVAPTSETEQKLVGIWQEVLGISGIGIDDNFFELGGDSLLVAQVVSRIQKIVPIELSINHLFEFPTLAGLSAYIEANHSTTQDTVQKSQTPVPDVSEEREEGEI